MNSDHIDTYSPLEAIDDTPMDNDTAMDEEHDIPLEENGVYLPGWEYLWYMYILT